MVPSTKPAIEGLFFDDQGLLWVQRITSRDSTEFDVIDAGGRLIGIVASPFRPPPYFRPQFHGDRIYFIGQGEDDLPQVVRTRLVKSPAR